MEYLIEDTTEIDASIKNLEIILEYGDYENGEVSYKVQRWAQDSTQTVTQSIKQKLRQIIVKIKHLFGIKTFDKNIGNVKILVDISGFNKLARFIESTKTYKVANFGPNNVASYGRKINIVSQKMLNKAEDNAKKLQMLYSSMKNEMRSRRARMVTQAATEMKSVKISDESQFRSILVPFIRNMLIATKKINQLITKMNKSFINLSSHMHTIGRKIRTGMSAAYNRLQKEDLVFRCVNYVAYANKLLTTTCQKALERIDRLLNHYYNIFGENK